MFVLKDQATNFTDQMANRTAIIRAAQSALIAPSSTVATTTTTIAAGRKKREEEEEQEVTGMFKIARICCIILKNYFYLLINAIGQI